MSDRVIILLLILCGLVPGILGIVVLGLMNLGVL